MIIFVPMDYKYLNDKKFALAVIGIGEDGKEELQVFDGTVNWDGKNMHFSPSTGDPSFMLPPEYLSKIEKAKDEFMGLTKEAEYVLTLRVSVTEEDTKNNPSAAGGEKAES